MKKDIVCYLKEYLVPIICAFVVAIILTEIEGIGSSHNIISETRFLFGVSSLFSSIICGSFFFIKLFAIYKDEYNKFLNNSIISKIKVFIKNDLIIKNIIVFILPLILYFVSKLIVSFYISNNSRELIDGINIIYVLLTYYLVVSSNKISVCEYISKIFVNGVLFFIFEAIIFICLSLLLYIYYLLFGATHFDWYLIIRLYIFLLVLLSYLGYFIIIVRVGYQINIFFKVLIKYIMPFFVFFSFLIFYIQFIGTIISRCLPSNEVFLVCSILFCLGLSTLLMARNFIVNNNIYDKILIYFPVLFIPALVLQMISLFLRINQYGFTQSRYLGIILLIIELAYIYLYFIKYNKLKYIFIVLSVLVLIVYYVPFINIYIF